MHEEKVPIEIYRAAYDQAEQELRRLQNEFDQLCVRHQHVAKAVEVLRPKVHFEDHYATGNMSLKTRKAGLSVVTRLTVMEKPPEF
ncbi:MAG TPA: hypothetical protein VG893_07540 [Terracidiphilus sp.]|nr:hypothetical protein [Terracidiphilus sp.]